MLDLTRLMTSGLIQAEDNKIQVLITQVKNILENNRHRGFNAC